jgi:hypothetical protein
MRLQGAAAICADGIVEDVRGALWTGRPFLVWSNGLDVTALVGDESDNAGDVLKQAQRLLPELV